MSIILAAFGAGIPSLAAQDTPIPVDAHVSILIKILNFDRNLPSKVRGEVNVGVLYNCRDHASARVAEQAREALVGLPPDILSGFPIHAILIDLDHDEDLGAVFARDRLHALYIAPMRQADLDSVVRVSRTSRILTLTGMPRYVDTGVAVGIDRKNGRSQIVVNVAAARAEGSDFTAQLLKLARIVGGGS